MYFLDTDTCINFLRGKLPYGYQLLQNSDPRLYKVPAIVAAELYLGTAKSQNQQNGRACVEQFLLPFEIVPFSDRCLLPYARLRAYLEEKGTAIGSNDTLIAATALAYDAVLVTNNWREFKRVPGLEIESWAEIDS